jgi:hypothetical protein
MEEVMKKISIVFMFVFLLAFFVFADFRVQAAGSEAYNIITNPAENMSSSININYHSDVDGSVVEFTKVSDTSYAESTKVNGECQAFSVPETQTYNEKSITSIGFTARKNCSVTLTNLDPDTEYKYRVGKTAFSGDYFFKTASNGDAFSFLYLTDPQYFNESTASTFNTLITKAKELDSDIRLSVFSGDIVDRAGDMSYWNYLFSRSNVKTMPFGAVPGNHEYYDGAGVTFNATYFNGFMNNPKNGAEGIKNSSYFFKYNNVLFIGLDSEAASSSSALLAAEKEWFGKVIESNFAQYIVVFMHRSFYGSIYADVSAAIRSNWQPLFDKYGVDLALTGHDHVYCRTGSIYNGVTSTDPNNGTVYLMGGSSGQKFYGLVPNASYPTFEKTIETTSTAQIFKVTSTGLELNTVDLFGNIQDSVIIPAKRAPRNNTVFDKQQFFDSIKVETVGDQSKAKVSWTFAGYTYLNSVKLIDESEQETGFDYIHTNKISSFEVTGLETNHIYNYTLKASFKDGSTLSRPVILSTKPSYGTIGNLRVDDPNEDAMALKWDAALQNDQIDKFRIYLDGVLFQELEETAVSTELSLSRYQENVIRLDAVDVYGDIVYTETITYGTDTALVTIAPAEGNANLKVGEQKQLQITANPSMNLSYIYTSSDESVAAVDATGKITAKAEGTATIEVHAAFWKDVKTTVTVSVTKAEESVPPKKGCGSALDIIVPAVMTLGAALFIFRRRRY